MGEVVSIDHFGNLITNIGEDRLVSFLGAGAVAYFIVGGQSIHGLSSSYDSGRRHLPLAIIGSRGAVEIAVNKESAHHRLAVAVGDAVRVVSSPTKGQRGGER